MRVSLCVAGLVLVTTARVLPAFVLVAAMLLFDSFLLHDCVCVCLCEMLALCRWSHVTGFCGSGREATVSVLCFQILATKGCVWFPNGCVDLI